MTAPHRRRYFERLALVLGFALLTGAGCQSRNSETKPSAESTTQSPLAQRMGIKKDQDERLERLQRHLVRIEDEVAYYRKNVPENIGGSAGFSHFSFLERMVEALLQTLPTSVGGALTRKATIYLDESIVHDGCARVDASLATSILDEGEAFKLGVRPPAMKLNFQARTCRTEGRFDNAFTVIVGASGTSVRYDFEILNKILRRASDTPGGIEPKCDLVLAAEDSISWISCTSLPLVIAGGPTTVIEKLLFNGDGPLRFDSTALVYLEGKPLARANIQLGANSGKPQVRVEEIPQ